jgi:hypothetical protein
LPIWITIAKRRQGRKDITQYCHLLDIKVYQLTNLPILLGILYSNLLFRQLSFEIPVDVKAIGSPFQLSYISVESIR